MCQSLEASLRTVCNKLDNQIATNESLQQRAREAESEAQRHLEAFRSLKLQTNADLSRQQCDSLSSKVVQLTKELEAKLSDANRHQLERIELMEASSKFKVN
jgi:galactokinase